MTIKKKKAAAIPLTSIRIGDNPIRRPNASHANQIAISFKANGQTSPIIVRNGIVLVGGNRFLAAEILGWATIEAIEVTCSDEEARLIEIDDNFVHRDLTELDRGTCLLEREQLYKALHPEITHGGDRRSIKMTDWHLENGAEDQGAEDARVRPFAYDAAEKMGLSSRTISRILKIRKALKTQTVIDLLADTVWADNRGELECVGQVEDPQEQIDLVREALETEETPSQVMARRRPPSKLSPPTPIEEEAEALFVVARKTSAAAHRLFIEKMLKQKGYKERLVHSLIALNVIREDQVIEEDAA